MTSGRRAAGLLPVVSHFSAGFRPLSSGTDMDFDAYYRDHLASLAKTASYYPYNVSIETWAVCNAACNFCPYPTMERKGDRMSDALFFKIVDELSEGEEYPNIITLARVNEPFLDKRIFRFSHYINEKLPKTKLHYFSNASPLNQDNIDNLLNIKNIDLLNISFNDHRPAEYEQIMQLPFEKTLANLDLLHRILTERQTEFLVRVSRVGDGTQADADYAQWVLDRFPGFMPMVGSRGDWMGSVETEVTVPVPDVGCGQWFQLHILADGRQAFCCIDAEGAFATGDATKTHVLEIYRNAEWNELRQPGLSRCAVGKCDVCVITP
jgi:hypothetical protein